MTVSQYIFFAIAQLAPGHLVLMHLGDSSERAENSNAFGQTVQYVAGALDQ